MVGGDFRQFVVFDEVQGLLQAEAYRRGENHVLIGAGGAHVGELLALGGVHHQVVAAAVDADQLAFVDFHVGLDQHAAALLQVEQGERQHLAFDHGDQHAVVALGHVAGLELTVVAEGAVEDAGAGGERQEQAAEADQAAAGHDEGEAHPALAVRLHVGHLAAAQAQLLHDGALVLLFHVGHDVFVGFLLLAVHLAHDHLRAAHGQLEAFTAHVLDQHRQVQLATAGDAELVGAAGFFHAQGHVVLELRFQALADLAAGDELAVLAGERRGVDVEHHAHGGLVHGQRRQGFHLVGVAQGVGDIQRVHAGDADDVAGAGFRHVHPVEAVVAHDLQDAAVTHLAFAVDDLDRGVGFDFAALDAADADHAQVAVVVQRGNLHLEQAVLFHFRRRYAVDDGLEQEGHVVAELVRFRAGHAVEGGGVDHREVELLVAGAEGVEQVEHLVDDPVRTGAGAVHLVDHHDRLEAGGECLLGHEAGLRHGAVHRVHQQQHRVDHGHDPLHLAAEVGVAGGVDDVDLVVAVLEGGVLGEDGDAPFLLQVVGVHHPFHVAGAISQGAGLLQQLVHQGGLAVVNVGDDGDIAQAFNHRNGSVGKKVALRPLADQRENASATGRKGP